MDTSRKKYDFVYNFIAAGKNITEVINVKERGNQLFKDKFVLVMLVLGLLTIVAAAGAVRIQKGRENIGESPYLEIEDPDHVIAGIPTQARSPAGIHWPGNWRHPGIKPGMGNLPETARLPVWQTMRMVPELALIPAFLPEKFRWIPVLLMRQIAP